MPKRLHFLRLLLVGTVLPFGGCKESPPTTPNKAMPKVVHHGKKPADKSETADQAVLAVLQGLKSNQPIVLWQALPVSYQQDVNTLVREFAEKVDEELWQRSVASLHKLLLVLKAKKQFFLKNPYAPQLPISDQEHSANWDKLTALLDTLVESELADLEKLKSFDGRTFLSGTGASLMEQFAAFSSTLADDPFKNYFQKFLGEISVTVLKSEGDTTIVRLEAPGAEPDELELVRVDGKWIPKDLSENWKSAIERARLILATEVSPEAMAVIKSQVLEVLDIIDPVLDKMQQAKTADEFNQAMEQGLQPLAKVFPELAQPGRPTLPPDTTGGAAVRIVVKGKLDRKTEQAIDEFLLTAVPDAEADVFPDSGNDATTYVIEPVTDIKALAKQVDFGTVTGVDEKKRVIRVKLNSADKNPDSAPSTGTN